MLLNASRAGVAAVALAGLLFMAPQDARAQQQPVKVPKVGVLTSLPIEEGARALFERTMQERDWVVGKTLTIEYRHAAGRPNVDAHRPNATELVSLPVDALVAIATGAARASQQATKEIPIVAVAVGDPVSGGFLKSLARPEGNITAITIHSGIGVTIKRLQLLKDGVPSATRIAVLRSAIEPSQPDVRVQFSESAKALGLELLELFVQSPAEVEPALRKAKDQGAQALFVAANEFAYFHRKLIADAALANRLPASVYFAQQVEAGALMSYANNLPEHFRMAALYVDRILKGEKVANLPVQQPDRYELVINLKTARAIGLTVPQQLLLQADRLIE